MLKWHNYYYRIIGYGLFGAGAVTIPTSMIFHLRNNKLLAARLAAGIFEAKSRRLI